ncbi:MAG: hypothetical protein QGH29_03215 [Kiritimatiellia bacterium]|jgi:hypothetical protein|nr:hypothetical protein [Kiritimatiellia bacterium]
MTMRIPASRLSEYRRILKSFDVFDVPAELQELILEALNSESWDWFEDCDGCTCVSEMHWPTKYFPPCVRHDFDWIRGQGDLAASKRFYALQRAYGVPIWRASLRASAVTVFWYAWARWLSR